MIARKRSSGHYRAPHGTVAKYKRGCRCLFCRNAATVDRRRYRRSS